MTKFIFLKFLGTSFILGTVISAILYGSPLSIFWDSSAFLMAITFIIPSFFFGSNETKFSSYWGAVFAGIIGLITMMINIKDPLKVGLPMAFSILCGFYIFTFNFCASIFENSSDDVISKTFSYKKWLIFVFLAGATAFELNRNFGLGSIFDLVTIMYFVGLILVFVLSKQSVKNIAENTFQASFFIGIVLFLISIVQILQNLSNRDSILPSMGVASLGLLYALFTGVACLPFIRIQKKHIEFCIFFGVCLCIYISQVGLLIYLL